MVDFDEILSYFGKYYWIVGSVLIVFGILELFFGSKLYIPTVYLFSFFFVSSLTFIIFYEVILQDFTENAEFYFWLGLAGSVIIGIISGYYLSKISRLFFGIFGVLLGFLLGTLLYALLIHKINLDQKVLFYSTIVIFGLTIGIISFNFHNILLILYTSIFGSYLFVRVLKFFKIKGISLFVGGFPDEKIFIDLVYNQQFTLLNEVKLNLHQFSSQT